MIHTSCCCTAVAVVLLALPAAALSPSLQRDASGSNKDSGSVVGVATKPPQVTNVGGTHYSGQTFLTWSESALLSGESYRVYRSTSKIFDVRDAGVVDLGQQVWEDSGEYFAGRVFDDRPCEHNAPDCGRPMKPLPCFRPRYVQRYWIPSDLGDPREVAPDEGLLVWTPDCTEFGRGVCEGWAWYAVTVVDATGNENPVVTASNRVLVYERVRNPLPIEVPREYLDCSIPGYCPHESLGDPNPMPQGVHVLIQYMDLKDWNTTFYAPNYTNCWWGEDPTAMHIRNAQQYAFAYMVSEPDPAFAPCPPGQLPIVVDLHHHNGQAIEQGWGLGGKEAYAVGGCAVKIVPIDPGDTWWFGFAEDHDFRKPTGNCPIVSCSEVVGTMPPTPPYTNIPSSGDVVNYTEARVLRMVFDLIRNPPFQRTLDFDRVYVEGTSMGGSGALQFALRYPNVFAAAAAGKAMTDYGDYLVKLPAPTPQSDLRHELPQRWGAYPDLATSTGLPLLGVRTIAPGKWGDHLAAHDGTVVWDWMDHITQITAGTGHALDSAPFGVSAGFQDDIIPYPHQGRPFFAAFGNLGRTWGGKIGCGGHGGSPYVGLPPSLTASAVNPFPAPYSDYNVRRVETIPGFVALTGGHYPIPPTVCCNTCAAPGPYYYFHDLIWSSTWYDWDQPPVDVPDRWEMSLRWTGSFAPPPTVDIVPRRLTHFQVEPGELYSWMNVEVGTGTVIQPASTPITPGSFTGLLRIIGIQLTPPGNRIVLVKL